MNFPESLKYTKEHEWIRAEDGAIGITDFAQGELGDIVYVQLPAVGARLTQGKTFGTIEAVKAVSDLYAPVSGTVTEVNETLANNPEVVNKDPYGNGWMIKISVEGGLPAEGILSVEEYKKLVGA